MSKRTNERLLDISPNAYAATDDAYGDDTRRSESPSKRKTLYIVICVSLVIIIAIVAAILILYKDSDDETTPIEYEQSWGSIRLPLNVIPFHYALNMSIILSTLSFGGTVSIDVNVLENLQNIVLHSSNLDIQSISISNYANLTRSTPNVTGWFMVPAFQYLVINSSTLSPGAYTVNITYNGILPTNRTSGLYASQWKLDNSTSQLGAFTQFERRSARLAFPCFDEPALRATFDISLLTEPGNTALSNGEIVSSEPEGPLTRTVFNTTKSQSTYLIAIAVAPFDYISTTSGPNNIPFRTFNRVDRVQYSTIMNDAGAMIQGWYETYFNIPFPFFKQDQIDVPGKLGAMENIGLVTYGSNWMFYIPGVTTSAQFTVAVMVTAHELGHMWFGDIVTNSWWTELWVKEGYAEYLGFVGADAWAHSLGLEWYMEDRLLIEDVLARKKSDSRFYLNGSQLTLLC